MNRIWKLTWLFLLPCFASAQYQYQGLNHINDMHYFGIYQKSVDCHSAVRPFNRYQLDTVVPVEPWREDLKFGFSNVVMKKLFDEDLVNVRQDGFSFTINPVFNFRIGGDLQAEERLYTSTRGLEIQGRIGKKFSFQSSFLENQSRLPGYIRAFADEREVVPGQGFARTFGANSLDYGIASGLVSYNPNNIFSFTLGQGRHFFGEGYRSMLLSDAAFNYPFFRIETTFWKVKYVNLWAQMYDVRNAVSSNDVFDRKFMSSHYLSINVTPRLNVGFFEAIVVGDTLQQKGVDISFFNPVILYRPVEFAIGSGQGNAVIGFNASYKLRDGLLGYGQFLLDEFNFSSVVSGDGSWQNKFGWQLGIKMHKPLAQGHLFARLEHNASRPYTYSHFNTLTNYGHYGQPLAHPWGGNFKEFLVHGVWQHKRWELEARYHLGFIGLDTNNSNWGSDIYISYDDRELDDGNTIAQGAEGVLHYLYLRGSWLMNPKSNMKLELGFQFRDMITDHATRPVIGGGSSYVFIGVRTEFYNNYYDF